MCLSFLHLICLLERCSKICHRDGGNDSSIFKSHFDILGAGVYSLLNTQCRGVLFKNKLFFFLVIENTSALPLSRASPLPQSC